MIKFIKQYIWYDDLWYASFVACNAECEIRISIGDFHKYTRRFRSIKHIFNRDLEIGIIKSERKVESCDLKRTKYSMVRKGLYQSKEKIQDSETDLSLTANFAVPNGTKNDVRWL